MILTLVTLTLGVLQILLFLALLFEYWFAVPERFYKITSVIFLGACFFQTLISIANRDWIIVGINALVCIIGSNFAMYQSLYKKIKP